MDFVPGGAGRTPAPQQPQRTTQPHSAPVAGTTTHLSGQKVPAQKSGRKLPFIIIAIVVVLALVGAIVLFVVRPSGSTSIDSSKYQAVFFTNGQVYFGKLQTNGDMLRLSKVFYLQSSQTQTTDSKNPQPAGTDQSGNLQLIKLGAEIHGPEDVMIINKDQVLFYENLKTDGTVSQKIKEYTQKNP